MPCAQKWYSITKNDAAIFALGAVSGAADGVNQNLAHWRWGKGKQFWDVKTSWKNKYKDFDASRGHSDATRGYHYHVDKAGANNFINSLAGAYAN